jgi:ABC-type sugar transport system permease subunit
LRVRPVPYLLFFPFFTAFILFWLIPLGEGFLLSLRSNSLIDESTFVGLKHYRDLFTDKRFFIALSNTLFYSIETILIVIPFSLVLAHLLKKVYKKTRGTIVFCLLLPGLTPPAVLAYLFLLVFIGRYGILNNMITAPLGLPKIDWIGDPDFIRISLVLQALWRWSGFVTFFLLSGLEGIPRTYYDIAKAEGAGFFQIFWRVTLPLLKNIIIFVCIFLFLDAFVLYEGAYVLLGSSGGTGDAALLLVGYTYQTAFSMGQFGTAAAMSFSVVPILMLILWVLLFQRHKRKFR